MEAQEGVWERNGGADGAVLALPVWVAPTVSRAPVSKPHLHSLEVLAVMLAALARPACYSMPKTFTMINDHEPWIQFSPYNWELSRVLLTTAPWIMTYERYVLEDI